MRQKNLYMLAAFSIILLWALWNYQVSLWLLRKLYDILLPFIIGASLAFIINVLMSRLEKLWQRFLGKTPLAGAQRPACLALSVAIILAFLGFMLFMVVPQLRASMKTVLQLLPPAWQKLQAYLQVKSQEQQLSQEELAFLQSQANDIYHAVLNYLQNNKRMLLSRTVSATASVLDVLTDLVIGIVAAMYILWDKQRLGMNAKRFIYAYCSRGRADYLLQLAQLTEKIFTGFVSGQLLVSLCLGVMYFAGMTIFGFPYALLISMLVAVLSLVPILGTAISAVVGAFLIFVAAPEKIWYFLLFFFVLNRIEADLLYPKIVGSAVGLSGLWVLAAVSIGGSIGGILGMIICVPLFSVINALLMQQVKQRLEQKNFPGS